MNGLQNLVISNSAFISNSRGGIVLGDGRDIMGNVTIERSLIRDSPGDGLHTDLSGESYLMLVNSSLVSNRSEERRVGKECRSRWSPYH